MSSVWDVLWVIIVSFCFVAYLMLMFYLLTDLFRDRATSGWVKAVWVVCLILFPLLTGLVYLIFRGSGMAERTAEAQQQARTEANDYIRQAAGTNSAAQIADGKKLLDAGAITEAEFQQLKAKALS
ncbi:SHOCT domain-containing protein [Nocardia fluminea]|jgi:ABC-type multidrug transport system fused ATPase/permease subunit|uniref:Putative oligomerization/nucleic acid binding protein n=1 Tax=Nocardia fluminea TaxID=134984 RepID=A0A2N3V734_9NOCA|nr:SHOCT domain-containing protein [Nocardia fluminea]PKV77438.1 putative oligomerization/nucleic acid binding protein [Nocardia fluminea]